jgi:hypothetical protein
VFLKSGGAIVSPWHGVPLFADAQRKTLNFVCEIPKETKAKAGLQICRRGSRGAERVSSADGGCHGREVDAH